MRGRLTSSRSPSGALLTAALLAIVLVIIAGCATPSARIDTLRSENFNPGAIKRVAFLPFVRLPVSEGERAVCPLDGRAFDACAIEDAAEAELSRAIGQALLADGSPVSFVPQSEINAARAGIKQKGEIELTPFGQAQLAVGKEVSADAVLFGFVFCYRERSGSAYASSRPAAIGFCLHLVETGTGKILWSFTCRDQQQPLSDNLLDLPSFVGRKAKFITVSQMAEEAAAEVLAVLPWRVGKS